MRNGMGYSEAGKLGGTANRQRGNEQRRKNIEAYNKNPKLCKRCETPIPYDKRRNSFCSHSCAASYNNLGVCRNEKKKRESENCLDCGNPLDGRPKQKYCGHECASRGKTKQTFRKIEECGLIRDTQRGTGRKYLISVRGHMCEICGVEEWCGKPTPLVLDHIDGHSENGLLENLRMVCPNCDAQLPTYKGRNRGNGRPHRYDAKVPSL